MTCCVHEMTSSPGVDTGAIFIDWTQDGIDHDASDTPVQLQTDSAIFAAEMQAKGITTDRPVVVCPQPVTVLRRLLYCIVSTKTPIRSYRPKTSCVSPSASADDGKALWYSSAAANFTSVNHHSLAP